jgi:dolichol-phosphate mannosyltransferase
VTAAATVSAPAKTPPNLSIVVPCYNEERVLEELYRRLKAACESAGAGNYEIILVNDGSGDTTWTVITDLCGRDQRVVGVNLSRNHGHQQSGGSAVRSGPAHFG